MYLLLGTEVKKMSRLYAWVESDIGEEITKTGNENMTVRINYGTKKDSKLTVLLTVAYPDGSDIPTVYVYHATGVKVHMTVRV